MTISMDLDVARLRVQLAHARGREEFAQEVIDRQAAELTTLRLQRAAVLALADEIERGGTTGLADRIRAALKTT